MLESAHTTVTLKASAPHENNSLEKAINWCNIIVFVKFQNFAQ